MATSSKRGQLPDQEQDGRQSVRSLQEQLSHAQNRGGALCCFIGWRAFVDHRIDNHRSNDTCFK
jgi:hypothetical protein